MSATTLSASTSGNTVVMPEVVEFTLEVGDVQAGVKVKGKQTKSGVSYKGSKSGLLLHAPGAEYTFDYEGSDVDDTLACINARLGDVVLNRGEIHTSKPATYRSHTKKDGVLVPNPKAGQLVPNTGGMRTVTLSAVADVASQFSTIFVTITKVAKFFDGAEWAEFSAKKAVDLDSPRVLDVQHDENGGIVRVAVDHGYTITPKVWPRVQRQSSVAVEGLETF